VSLRAVRVAGNKVIAVGANDTVVIRNGNTWSVRYTNFNGGTLKGVAWTGSTYVAVGDKAILTSTDGMVWAPLSGSFRPQLGDVIWTGSSWIACGSVGYYATSPDGITWSRNNLPTTYTLTDIAWNGSRLVATAENSTLWESVDGNSWTSVLPSTLSPYTAIASVGGRMFATAGFGGIIAEDPSSAWGITSTDLRLQVNDLAVIGDQLVSVMSSGHVMLANLDVLPALGSWATSRGLPLNLRGINDRANDSLIPNLVTYGLNLPANLVQDAAPVVMPGEVPGSLSFQFLRGDPMPGVRLAIEGTTADPAWQWSELATDDGSGWSGLLPVQQSQNGQVLEARIVVNPEQVPRQFSRLAVRLAPTQ